METECSEKQQVDERLTCEHFLGKKNLEFEMEMKTAIFPLYRSRGGGEETMIELAKWKKITLAEVIVQGVKERTQQAG